MANKTVTSSLGNVYPLVVMLTAMGAITMSGGQAKVQFTPQKLFLPYGTTPNFRPGGSIDESIRFSQASCPIEKQDDWQSMALGSGRSCEKTLVRNSDKARGVYEAP